MCTSIIEIARAEGMAKRGDEWFPLSRAVVAYDHARHAPLGDVITLDFINTGLEPGARAGIELTLETAKELRAALDRAIAAAEFEEAEVRGKGAVPSLAPIESYHHQTGYLAGNSGSYGSIGRGTPTPSARWLRQKPTIIDGCLLLGDERTQREPRGTDAFDPLRTLDRLDRR
jgi:Family of unknown function (DUF6295)